VTRAAAPRAAAALLACAAPAAAQEAPEIVVTGRGLDAAPGDRTAAAVEIGRERLTANAAQRLESVLADAAGLQQFRRSDSRSANPTSQGITLRGLGGNAASRALLILDGVPQADPFGGWVAFPAYAADRLASVRVTRGAGGGALGAGALAGTVELDSAGADPLPAARLSYGSRNALDAGGGVGFANAGGFATLSGAYARGDGFVPVERAARGPADRPAPYKQWSAAARAVVRAGDATELQANVAAFDDRRERGTAFTDNRSRGADASLRAVGRGRWRWSALAYLQARDFASRFAAVGAGRAAATPTLDQYSTPSTGLGARAEVEPPLPAGLRLRLGADVRDVSGTTNERYTFVAGAPTRVRRAGGAQRTTGLFADGAAEAGPLTASLAARVDRWAIRDGALLERPLAGGPAITDARFPDRDGTEGTGRAGLAWRVAAPVTLRAAAYTAWRLPTLNELYRPFRVGADAVAANADLRPERVRGYEGGVTLTPLPSVTMNATVFRNRLARAVVNVTEGRGPGNFPGVGFVAANGAYRVRRNVDAVDARGFELDAAWRPAAGPLGASLSWSRTSARVEGSGAAAPLDGLRPAQVPRNQLSATLDARAASAAAALTLRRVSGQWDDDANTRRLAPATTLDAYAALPLTRHLSVEARAENLFDAVVEAASLGTDAAERATPRTIWLGLRFRPR